MRSSLIVAGLLTFALTQAAHASAVYDGFNYPSGSSLAGQNGGTGWAGAWDNSQSALDVKIAAGLTFGGLATSPGSAQGDPAALNVNVFYKRQLGSSFGADNTTVFMSFLLHPDASPGFYGGLNFGGLFVGQSGITTTYGIEAPTNDISSTGISVVPGTTVFLVLRADFLPGNDKFSLYVDPTPGGTEPALADAIKTNFDLGTTDFIFMNNAGGWTTDEIRIGDTFASVTPTVAAPEPTTLVLLATAVPIVGLRRWRHTRL